jgi:hypothetical protein
MGVDIDTGKIEAVCESGVLTLALPKSPKAKPMKIKVKEAWIRSTGSTRPGFRLLLGTGYVNGTIT